MAKKSKKKYVPFIIIGIILILILTGYFTIQKGIVKPVGPGGIPIPGEATKIQECENGGGEWRWFSDGCVDSCGKKPRMCTQALATGCDCGPTKCWDTCPSSGDIQVCGKPRCADDPYEPYATQQEACEKTNGLWGKTGTRCPVIKNVEIVDGKKIETCPVQEEDIINCQCPEGETFYTDGCSTPRIDLMSIIIY